MNLKKLGLLAIIASLMIFTIACGGGTSAPASSPSNSENNAGNNQATDTPGNASEGEKYHFKLAHITPTNHPWHMVAEKFKEELETRTDGRMTVDIYPASQLGTEADMFQQVEAGSVDFAFLTAAYVTSRSEAYSALFAPYLFDSYEALNESRYHEATKNILATLDDQGVKAMDVFFSGHRVMMFKDKKVMKPEDLQGMKIRVTPSPVLQDFFKSLGASPESIPLPDVYQALQTGVIDGMDMDLDAGISNNFAEVAKYGLHSNHMSWPSIAIGNPKLLDGMTDADRELVYDALDTAAEYGILFRAGQEEEFKQTLIDQGMEIYETDNQLFASQIEQFDETYSAKDPLIKAYIEAFRK